MYADSGYYQKSDEREDVMSFISKEVYNDLQCRLHPGRRYAEAYCC